MASPFRKGALTRMKERRAAAPLMDTEMAGPHTVPIADTQAERQMLSPQAEASTVQRDDPEMLSRVTIPQPTPHFTEGKQVFTDQKEVEELYAEADTPPLTSFKSEFKAARKRGDKEFSYKGDRFNTRERGETDAGWLQAIRTPFEPGFTRERAVADVPSRRPNEGAIGYLMGDTDFDDIKFTPTSKQKSIMEAPVETKHIDRQAPSKGVTKSLNEIRSAANMSPLSLNSGFRTPEESAAAMMNSVSKAKNWDALKDAGYNHHNYPRLIKAYLANKTPENLQAIGDERLKRENSGLLTSGHGTSDSADYSVRDLTKRSDALKRVEWLRSQGLDANLEYWDKEKKDANAHIHVNGINDKYDALPKVN